MYMLFHIWDQQEFVLSLKRQIITETQILTYKKLFQFVELYLQQYKISQVSFNNNSFLVVFQSILTQHYDIIEQNENQQENQRAKVI